MFPHKDFGSKELEQFLNSHGYWRKKSSASSHAIIPIKNRKITEGERPFMVVILDRKPYDPVTQDKILAELRRKGFTDNELKEYFT